jgi:hypothetical protein
MYAVLFHTHQKLDKVAYRHLKQLAPNLDFPPLEQILHFEGANGPDATKLKKQVKSAQPWHFVDPLDKHDTDLHKELKRHYKQLVHALKDDDQVLAAFQAAWLAHALVDGLTPAHHYPYEKELALLRGESRHTRTGLLGRGFVQADTLAASISRSLKIIGPKGLLTNHAMFEGGAWAIIAPLRLNRALPSSTDVQTASADGMLGLFKQMASEVANLQIYTRFIDRGWRHAVARDIRRELAPRMVRMITLAWYSAARDAGLLEKQ